MCHYRNDYVSVRIIRDWETKKIIDLIPEFNNLMRISDMRAFEVQQIDYKDRFTVFSAVHQNGIEGATIKSCEMVEEFNHYGDSKDKLRMLVRISEDKGLTKQDIIAFLELIPPKYKDYYETVGPDRIKANRYRESDIKKELRKEKTGGEIDERVVTRIYDLFKIGKRYTNKDIKEKLKVLYQEFEYKKTAKAKDLELLFVMKPILTPDKQHGVEILGKR
jgi:hypothetical protein